MADFSIKLTINGDGSVAVRAVNQVEGATRQMASTARQAGQQAGQSFEVAAKGAATLGAEVTQAKNAVASLVAMAGGSAALRGFAGAFISAADAAGQLQARVKLATQSQAEYEAVMERMQQIAHDSYVSINDIAEVYIRSIDPMRQLGYSTRETLDLTEAMSLALVVSAADTQKRASAVDALSKVMQTGNVHMQEFITLTTAAPRFVAALEASLGKTRAELIDMVSAGKLTAGELAKVGSELDKLRAEVELMPTTVGDAATRFRDAFQVWSGAANEGWGATALLVLGIDALSNHIDAVMTVALIAAAGTLAHLITQGGVWIANMIAQRTAAVEAARATVAKAQAEAMDTTATLANAQAAVANAQAKLAMARSNYAATAATVELAGAQEALTAAQLANEAAQKRLAGATTALNGKLLSLGAAMGVLFAAFTGYEIGTWLRDQFEIVRVAADYFVGASLDGFNRIKQGALIAWEGVKAVVLGAINTIREKLADAYGMYAALAAKVPGGGALAEQLGAIEAKLRPTSSAADDFKAALERINGSAAEQSKSIWTVIGDMVSYEAQATKAKAATEEYARTGVVTSATLNAAFAELAKSVDGEMAKLQQQNFLIGKGAEGQYEYAKSLAMAKAATIEDGAARAAWIAKVNETYDPLIKQAKANDELKDSYSRAKKGSEEAAKTAADFVKSLEDRQAALEREIATFGMSEGAIARYDAANMNLTPALRQRMDAVADSINALNAEKKAMEDGAKVAVQYAGSILDQLAADTRYEQSLVKMTARQRAVAEAQKTAADTFKKNNKAFENASVTLEEYVAAAGSAAGATFDMTQEAAGLEGILSQFGDVSPFEQLVSNIDLVKEALDNATDPAQIERLQRALGHLNKDMEQRNLQLMQQGVSSLQTFAKEGTAAYTALGIAQDVLAYKSAVAAIANQGSGDPYSAFARIAAMIALMASIG
ncbi:MAG: hypothetical protein RL684_266, partial [Pseudomonadota bacterium]